MEARDFAGFFFHEAKAVVSRNGRFESFGTVLPSIDNLPYLDNMRPWSGIRRFASVLTLLLVFGCSDEGSEENLAESSFEQRDKVALNQSVANLKWELERLKLKVVTVDGEDMVLAKETGLWHYDL